MQKVVFASSNPGKIRELNDLLSPVGMEIIAQDSLGIKAAEETAHTFVENALLKARHASAASGLPAIADDSGLEVDALNGAPGLYSARHAERHDAGTGDVANYELLLAQLSDLPDDAQRSARFRTVVVYLKHEFDPSPLIAEGSWEGHILHAPQGDSGFGYDPVFCNHDTHTAAALLDKASKNRLSHRGKAVALLVDRLKAIHEQGAAPL
ncbi:RdgB/HAM1 family non-canonical purine NTP pyrophosphatase [Granulosicoccus antarcticus]|uniref:dITP/XTP pyrophosphatase n=1 Tax=Granulosicoccus antarcticus IMCC3135 TaxID=1192854 RepID=A0A2Z2NGQ4_9GAMM|nr:RdgB/HAM1 family non-canonical purine NTP pyrophosphatase [Granulosicoccus antarcticus]ASJ70466.1 dITP/XTP pyrophosphatase [Granulosicoccus antarcticus IMCC3135]